MKRRDFLKGIPVVAAPFLLNGIPINLMAQNSTLSKLAADSNNDRVLVLIQMHGGNDGLNTLIPIAQYNYYKDLRSNIAIVDKGSRAYIPLERNLPDENKIGLHPDMVGMQQLYNQGKLAIIQNVAYPNLNQSHFRSRDIWLTGSDADQYLGSGWMGRFLGEKYPGYPTNYPPGPEGINMPDPPAIEIGTAVSLAFHGDHDQSIPLSLSIDDPNQFYDLITKVRNSDPPQELVGTPYKSELEYITGMEAQSDRYAARLKDVYSKGNNTVSYPEKYSFSAPAGYLHNELSSQLKLIARLISGGCKTKVFLTRITKFDTHATQVEKTDPSMGAHAALLYHISSAMNAFQADLSGLQIGNRVMTVTFSEFGRRAASNLSYGTDHGNAAPMFVFGNCVNPGVIGAPDLLNLDHGNLKMEYDYRQVFTTLIQDWMGASDATLDKCNFAAFKSRKLNLVNKCNSLGVDDSFINARFNLGNCYPNPAKGHTTFTYKMNAAAQVSLKIYNSHGVIVKEVINQYQPAGEFTIPADLTSLQPGAYVYKIEAGQLKSSKKLIIMP